MKYPYVFPWLTSSECLQIRGFKIKSLTAEEISKSWCKSSYESNENENDLVGGNEDKACISKTLPN